MCSHRSVSGEKEQTKFSLSFRKKPNCQFLVSPEKKRNKKLLPICLDTALTWWSSRSMDTSHAAHTWEKPLLVPNIIANPSQQWVSLCLSRHPALCTDSLLKSLQEKAFHIQAPQGFGHKRPFSLTMVKIWAKGKDDPGQRWKFQGDEMWNIVKATLATWPHPVTSEELSCFFHCNICTWTRNYIFFFLQLGGKVPLLFLILEYAWML